MLQGVWEMFMATGFGFVLLWCYAAVIWIPAAFLYAVFKAATHLTRIARKQLPDSAAFDTLESTPGQPASRGILWPQWILTSLPAMLFLSLFLMMWRAKTLLGHWPQAMADDPKWIGTDDFIYQRLYDWTDLSFGIAGWSLISWLILFIAGCQSYSHKQRRGLAWTYALIWMLAILGTGNGIEWYMD